MVGGEHKVLPSPYSVPLLQYSSKLLSFLPPFSCREVELVSADLFFSWISHSLSHSFVRPLASPAVIFASSAGGDIFAVIVLLCRHRFSVYSFALEADAFCLGPYSWRAPQLHWDLRSPPPPFTNSDDCDSTASSTAISVSTSRSLPTVYIEAAQLIYNEQSRRTNRFLPCPPYYRSFICRPASKLWSSEILFRAPSLSHDDAPRINSYLADPLQQTPNEPSIREYHRSHAIVPDGSSHVA